MPNPEISLERTSTKPLFAQVAQSLNTAIASGGFRPGQQIRTEPELAATYGVSRITVRRAIEELCQHGLLIKRQGKGTFVRESKMARKIEHISSFSESCRASGMVPSAEVLRRELLDSPPPDASGDVDFDGEPILYIQRVHYADGVPIMIENNYYPHSRFHFLVSLDLRGSLFEALADHGITVGGSRNSYIDAMGATEVQAQLLNILVGEPIFFFYREMLDDRGALIYVGRQHITASRYRFNYDAK